MLGAVAAVAAVAPGSGTHLVDVNAGPELHRTGCHHPGAPAASPLWCRGGAQLQCRARHLLEAVVNRVAGLYGDDDGMKLQILRKSE